MSLFDGTLITLEEIRERYARASGCGTIRKITKSGCVYTVRHRPWHEMLGPGPEGMRCKDCQFLTGHRLTKRYYKCGRQIQTYGAGTDIRLKDQACRLFKPEERT